MIITVANQKGGAAKTTTAVHLAHGLAERGRHIVVIDLDPQGTASRWLGWEPSEGLAEALVRGRGLARLAVPTNTDGLDLIPGDPWLAGAAANDFDGAPRPQMRLAASSRGLGEYELALIDSPPTLGLLAVNALAAADQLIVPVPAGAMELEHLDDLHDTVDAVAEDLDHHIGLLAVVMVKARHTRLSSDVYDRLADRYGETLCTTTIRHSVRVAESFAHSLPVAHHAPGHGAAADFAALADEIHERIRK